MSEFQSRVNAGAGNAGAMVRVAGVNIPGNKKLSFSLRYIYGIGPKIATEICTKAGIDAARRTHTLSEEEIIRLANVANTYTLEGELRKKVYANIQNMIHIKSYRGGRHLKRLPVRGQNTRNNARTRKGAKKSAIANKKKPGKK